jgi:hypothetical protein
MPLPWQTPYSASISNPRSLPKFEAWYDMKDAGARITATGVQLLADKSGNSGVNVLALNGVAGNYASAPDAAPLDITGPIDMVARAAAVDWTSGAVQVIMSKAHVAGNYSYQMDIGTTGTIRFVYSPDGTTLRIATSSSVAPFTDLAAYWMRATYNSATGDVNFYYAADQSAVPTSWTQLGTTQVLTAGTIFSGNNILEIGTAAGGTANRFTGLIYRAQIYNGIAGTLAFDANFATAAKLATSFTESSSNAATVTINTTGDLGARICGARDLVQMTGTKQPTISGGGALFDGTDDYMKAAAFSLAQPTTVYFVGQQVTWTINDRFFDGGDNNTMLLYQATTTPNIRPYSTGGDVATNVGTWALGTNAIVTNIYSTTLGATRINRATAQAQTLSSSTPNGFTLGASVTGSAPSNMNVLGVLIYSAAHDTATQNRVIKYLSQYYGIAV